MVVAVARRARRIIKLIVMATVAVVVGLVLHRCYQHDRGIEVCLHSVDSHPLRSGEVAVRSDISTRSYAVRDLAPGDTACVWVKADSEASVDVTFTTPTGEAKVMLLNGYIEQDYSGRISADVAAEGARNVHEDIDVYERSARSTRPRQHSWVLANRLQLHDAGCALATLLSPETSRSDVLDRESRSAASDAEISAELVTCASCFSTSTAS